VRRGGATEPGPGLNLVVGVVHEDGLLAEVKIGTFDSPRIKLAIGYQLRLR
jgi:hypothetical protein